MSDTAVAPESIPPIPPSPESTPEPAQEAAPAVAPAEPPPASDDQAGADAPPADAPPGDVPAAAALDQTEPAAAIESAPTAPVIESVPVPEGTKTSEPITTPVEARLALGDDSGLPPDVVDEHPVAPAPEHPHTTLQRIREKLAAYGEECLEAVRHEIEYLQNLFHTHLPPPGGDVS